MILCTCLFLLSLLKFILFLYPLQIFLVGTRDTKDECTCTPFNFGLFGWDDDSLSHFKKYLFMLATSQEKMKFEYFSYLPNFISNLKAFLRGLYTYQLAFLTLLSFQFILCELPKKSSNSPKSKDSLFLGIKMNYDDRLHYFE